MNLPQRKATRLKDYDYGTWGAYFITICTKNRNKILSNIVGEGFPLPQLTPYGKIADKWVNCMSKKYNTVSVDKYVIMPDHIHLLLSLTKEYGRGDPSPTVDNVIGWLKYQITKEINEVRQTQGQSVFQRSYYDHVIRNEQDFKEAWDYIENNPMKWLLTHKTAP